jgi:hypothetical protein
MAPAPKTSVKKTSECGPNNAKGKRGYDWQGMAKTLSALLQQPAAVPAWKLAGQQLMLDAQALRSIYKRTLEWLQRAKFSYSSSLNNFAYINCKYCLSDISI